MYPAIHAANHPDRLAYIMAGSGETVSYRELDERSNRLAHLLRSQGLKRLDHFSIFMENNAHYVIANAAGERTGLYYTCINSYLTAEELAYIINNSESQILITSRAKRATAEQALPDCPALKLCLIVDAPSDGRFVNLDEACAPYPPTPVADEGLGTAMLYSSGTTGRPKGVLRPLPQNAPKEPLPLFHFLTKLWRYREGMRYLSPAPLYHAPRLCGHDEGRRHCAQDRQEYGGQIASHLGWPESLQGLCLGWNARQHHSVFQRKSGLAGGKSWCDLHLTICGPIG